MNRSSPIAVPVLVPQTSSPRALIAVTLSPSAAKLAVAMKLTVMSPQIACFFMTNLRHPCWFHCRIFAGCGTGRIPGPRSFGRGLPAEAVTAEPALDVLYKVVGMLQADAEADEKSLIAPRRYRTGTFEPRRRDQAVEPSPARTDPKQLELLEEGGQFTVAAGAEHNREHAACPLEVAFPHGVARIAGQWRIEHPFDAWVPFKALGNLQGGGGLTFQAGGQRSKASQRKKAVVGRGAKSKMPARILDATFQPAVQFKTLLITPPNGLLPQAAQAFVEMAERELARS